MIACPIYSEICNDLRFALYLIGFLIIIAPLILAYLGLSRSNAFRALQKPKIAYALFGIGIAILLLAFFLPYLFIYLYHGSFSSGAICPAFPDLCRDLRFIFYLAGSLIIIASGIVSYLRFSKAKIAIAFQRPKIAYALFGIGIAILLLAFFLPYLLSFILYGTFSGSVCWPCSSSHVPFPL